MSPSTALLVVGYVLAVPTTAAVLRIAWRRQVALLLVLEAGTLAVVLGWALRGRAMAAWTNAGFAVGFLVCWVVVGRIRRRREAPGARP